MTATFADYGIQIPVGACGNIKVQCPKCHHTHSNGNKGHKDLSVDIDRGFWNCHRDSCDFHGSLGATRQPPPIIREYKKPIPIKPATPSDRARLVDWFQKRGISSQVLDRNRITTHTASGKTWIAFPHYRDGEHIFTAYRTLDDQKECRQSPGADRCYFGLDDITPETTEVIIVEGHPDKLAFEMAGYTNVLSVPDGAPNQREQNSDKKFSFHDSAVALFDRIDRVILATDSDGPGRALASEIVRRVGADKCWTVTWPEGVKDANDMLRDYGVSALQFAVKDIRPWPRLGVTDPDDILDDALDMWENGTDPGLRLGLTNQDSLYRVVPGAFTVLTGHSSHGKSLWLDHMLIRMAKRHGWYVAIFSPENAPLKLHYKQLLEIHLGKPFDRRIGGHMSRDDILDGHRFLQDHFTFLTPDAPTIDAILDHARFLVKQRGLNGLVIDPWNQLDKGDYGKLTETQYTEHVLPKIIKFDHDCNVHTWLCAHPTKIIREKDGREAVPQLDHINGSIHFRNMCDMGICIWRDTRPGQQSDPSQCHVLKVRFRDTGTLGMSPFTYHWPTRSIQEVAQ